jgi:16S rRNA (uracil1498-N3)-methyltransferase
MARELRRLLIGPERLAAALRADGGVTLQPEESHYLGRVLRLRSGDPVAVIDGCGSHWQACLGDGGRLEALQRCGAPEPRPHPGLTLALALPRREVELVWRMACELGIDRLQTLRAQRSPVMERQPQQKRWQAVLREATEQCERLWIPQLEPIERTEAWFSHPAGEALSLLATTRHEGLPELEGALGRSGRAEGGPTEIRLAIGPEGGWSPDEERIAEAAGWQPVSLGSTILRSSTAAVAACSRLVAWRLSCASCRAPSP